MTTNLTDAEASLSEAGVNPPEGLQETAFDSNLGCHVSHVSGGALAPVLMLLAFIVALKAARRSP
ncbi:hypothetical protein AKJ09_00572 [Labilithrix luteola]|uniref:Uncharacterized protein n=1 Tax=Labilithrix luteola TaxID=1391654 RepID=A0A0K1PK40_9BACT|nr:hypothetical protein [Labilithrix luteola]AKU93908.1 hypothetical protein AKJ09_00572 [Labilithrix luteola]